MTERTALEIALDLDAAACSSFVKLEAAEALRKQHAEIERLIAINSALTEKSNSYVIENARQAKEIERLKTVPMKYRRMAFNAQLQEENTQLSEKIERLTALNSALTAKGNVLVIANARLDEKIFDLTAERDAAIANVSALTQHLTQVIGDHNATSDCFSSGPMFGDPRDAICPACAALHFLSNPRASVDSGRDAAISAAVAAERAACAATAPDLLWALETIIDASPEPPEANCSCHICPPCGDCVDYEELREAYRYVRAAIAKAAGESA